ncbi:MAG TPA: serine protease [Burkholderiaceae bacterium]|nr:serine protease [Burkholderiaceae bacterium]
MTPFAASPSDLGRAGPGPRRRSPFAAPGLLGATLVGLWPAAAPAQSVRGFYDSVVQVLCREAGGAARASSGFVWRDEGHVVTTLHSVAGCNLVNVFSEAAQRTSPAKVVSVHHEPDLALLKLERPLGLRPLQHAEREPDLDKGPFRVVGYPLATQKLGSYPVHFTEGRQGWAMSLDDAYSEVQGKRELFAGVSFPTGNATIFRVASLLQPGQSGAPILDPQGRVVAIVDGGMRDGYLGLNWSIPTHKYLSALPSRGGAAPAQPSKWSQHFSALLANPPKFVELPGRVTATTAGAAADGAGAASGALLRLRTMSLADLEALLRQRGRWKDESGNLTFIRQTVGAKELAALTFHIFYDPASGATFGVPTLARLSWDARHGTLETMTASGRARVVIGVQVAASHAQARTTGRRTFIDKILPLAAWDKSPATLAMNVDEGSEYAQGANFFAGRERGGMPVSVNLNVSVSGRKLLAYALYGPDDIVKDLSDLERAQYLMMQYGVQELSGFSQQ